MLFLSLQTLCNILLSKGAIATAAKLDAKEEQYKSI